MVSFPRIKFWRKCGHGCCQLSPYEKRSQISRLAYVIAPFCQPQPQPEPQTEEASRLNIQATSGACHPSMLPIYIFIYSRNVYLQQQYCDTTKMANIFQYRNGKLYVWDARADRLHHATTVPKIERNNIQFILPLGFYCHHHHHRHHHLHAFLFASFPFRSVVVLSRIEATTTTCIECRQAPAQTPKIETMRTSAVWWGFRWNERLSLRYMFKPVRNEGPWVLEQNKQQAAIHFDCFSVLHIVDPPNAFPLTRANQTKAILRFDWFLNAFQMFCCCRRCIAA